MQGGGLGGGQLQPHQVSPTGRVASFSIPGSSSRYSLGPSLRRGHEVSERVQSNEMGTSVLIMQPILRFLQLLCENHNRDLQVSALPHTCPFPHQPAGMQTRHCGRCPSMACVPWPGHCCFVASGSPTPAAHKIVLPRPASHSMLQLCCAQPVCALQNFLRCQNNKTNYNLVCETLQFLDIMCGSTTGGLGLLGLYINEDNVGLVIQTLETLTEYCQGPCHENQVSWPGGTSGSQGGSVDMRVDAASWGRERD